MNQDIDTQQVLYLLSTLLVLLNGSTLCDTRPVYCSYTSEGDTHLFHFQSSRNPIASARTNLQIYAP